MAILNIIIFFLWLSTTVLDYGKFIYVWQLKEYRADRFNDFLSTGQGKDFLKSFEILRRSLLSVLIVIAGFFYFQEKEIWATTSILALLLFDFGQKGYGLIHHKICRPTVTLKAILIGLFSLATEISLFLTFKSEFILFVILILRFGIVSFWTGVFFLPTKIIKTFLVKKATKKIATFKNLKIIGITGSYGKTTVKNFLAQILEGKYRTIKTPQNINTEIGIAKFILQTDFANVDIFIVEMGAYARGEIKLICDMIRPQIGILTAINEQHLSLFGNIKNIQKTKYELLKSLPAMGFAIVNADIFYCREHLGELKCQVKTFGSQKQFCPNAWIKNIKSEKKEIEFEIQEEKNNLKIFSPIIGEHNVANIAPCILVAKYLGMTEKEIMEKCNTLVLPEKTLEIFSYGESLIIDDSYNANPDGFRAALQIFPQYDSNQWKKIVITRGMLELGEESPRLHREIGKEIARTADELVVITKDFIKDLQTGTGDKFCVLSIFDFPKIAEYIKKLKDKKCLVLLENRIPEAIKRELKCDK